jgi:hypothetical protein
MRPFFGEIFFCIVNDEVDANRSRQVHLSRAADGCDLSPKYLAICTAKVPTPPERLPWMRALGELSVVV